MKEEAITSLLNQIGCIPEDRHDDWLRVSCPLAHLTHESGRDQNPSAGVSIKEESPSVLHCFTCGTWPLFQILHILFWTEGISPEIFQFYLTHEVLKEESESSPIAYRDKFQATEEEEETPVSVPEELLQVLDPVESQQDFLDRRGISLEVAKAHNIKSYLDGLTIPIRDTDYKTYWLKYRSAKSKIFNHIEPEDFNLDMEWGRSDSWFGLEFLDTTRPVMLVESELEAMRLETLGWTNILAAHGSLGKKSKKLERLVKLGLKVVILGFDADEAGRRYNKIARYWLSNSHIIDLDWSKVDCQDPGEIGSKEQLEQVWKDRITHQGNARFQDPWRSIYEIV